ncbi:hypothetical protein NT6N_26770 [Oceaniferula spumae]|uniref:Glycosyltransferase n=1 Tax=Oceaniferula spumae TaxID=2979115 RepID=A0AAT9FP04_9BACT
MVEAALNHLEGNDDIELHVFGPKPHWKRGAEDHFRKAGRFHGSLSPDKLMNRVPEFDAILVTMSFEPSLKRRMMTSFPSKLIEGVQHGLPLIVWGPDYCSGIEWAKSDSRALCVTDSKAAALYDEIMKYKNARGRIDLDLFHESSRFAAENEFDPKTIRHDFRDILETVTCKSLS